MMQFIVLLFSMFAAHADENENLASLPPKTLYHMGQKKHLLENDQLGTISDEVWEKNIMGNDTKYRLVPYRRGLYGGANFDSLELYANSYLGSPEGKAKIPWPMKITIKQSCLQPEHVTDLATDEKYLQWLFSQSAFLAKNLSFCLNLKTTDCRNLLVLTEPIHKLEADPCDDVMQRLIVETKAKIVRDTTWDSSWYIRDRSCIEKLEAKPENVLEMLVNAKWDRKSRLYNREGINGHGLGTFAMLAGALKDSKNIEKPLLAQLRNKTAGSDIRLGKEESSKLWVKESGPALIDAYERCQKNGREALFIEAAAQFENELHDSKLRDRNVQQEKIAAFTSTLRGLCY